MFQIIKTLICLANVDSSLHQLEIQFIKNLISKYNLSETEKLELQSAISSKGSSYIHEFKKIESYFERGELISFARHMFHVDDHFDFREKESYDNLMNLHKEMSGELLLVSENAAKSMSKELKNKEFYRELEDFGNVLSKKRTGVTRFWIGRYPSYVIYLLLKEGGYAKKFAIFFVSIILINLVIRLIFY